MTSRSVSWGDLPPRPWPENTEPSADALADYLTSLSREHLVWLLGHQRGTWQQESECFQRAHESRLEHYEAQMDTAQKDLRAIMAALGISDHARPYSAHQVVEREVIPAIEHLIASNPEASS